jgi:cephalosporin-C deacetylase-like acetyl esterase
MQSYHIEKVIFESLPHFYVTALLYVPDNSPAPMPAVLVPCGHSTNGKIAYQYICHRLAKLGYVAISWDPVGQGERSQFWDPARGGSRYNLVCGEHAVLGNLAYLAGANLARWEIWDGMRAVDYLLSRREVDPGRISITGTSGGGFQAAHIGALDDRIKVVMPSCYISSLPMRMNNRIFKDPDSDPEQDLYGMVSNGVDHAGLLLMCYPRPVFVAAAVEDFFPIEGTRKTVREVGSILRRLGHPELIGSIEGYHGHKYSPENLEAAFAFLDRFNGMPPRQGLPPDEKLEDKVLQCTASGQVMLEFKDSTPLMELIREFYAGRKPQSGIGLASLYRGIEYPGIDKWRLVPYAGIPSSDEIAWEPKGSTSHDGLLIERYLIHHSERLAIPLLNIHSPETRSRNALLWFTPGGKATASDWSEVEQLVSGGYDVFTFDFRGLGEDRMAYKVDSVDAPGLAPEEYEKSYVSPLSGVLANYVYNSLLTGRPYFLQMIEDAEIVARFVRGHAKPQQIRIFGRGDAYTLAVAIAASLPGLELLPRAGEGIIRWSEIVEQKRELWPIEYLLPGGAYVR